MAITFSIPDTEIIMTAGQVEALDQDLLNASRLFEAGFTMMGFDHIVDAAGKAPLGAGVFTEIVLTLRDPWTLRFEDEGVSHVAVRGGTTIALDALGVPRPVSTNPSLTINQSISGTLVQDAGLYGGKTFAEVMEILLCMAQGRIVQTVTGPPTNVFEFYAQDNATVLYTLEQTSVERSRT